MAAPAPRGLAGFGVLALALLPTAAALSVPTTHWPRTPADGATQAALLLLPAAGSAALPPLLAAVTAAAGAPDEPLRLFALLLGKRAYLYALALSAVTLAALRSSDSPPSLGGRLRETTAEALAPLPWAQEALASDEYLAAERSLDAASPTLQVALLPLLLSATLLGSFALATPTLLGALGGMDGIGTSGEKTFSADALGALRGVALGTSQLSNLFVCALFVGIEAREGLNSLRRCADGANGADGGTPERNVTPDIITPDTVTPDKTALSTMPSAVAAAALVALASLAPISDVWQLQNVINICVAVSVARVLQLPSLGAIIGALTTLMLYDALFAAGGAQAAQALADSAGPAAFAAVEAAGGGGESVMAQVARAKLEGDGFTPGLLQVRLEGRLTDGLGLGDIVFPSMLAGWARRFDLRADGSADARVSSLNAVLGGYAAGCVALEIVPPQLAPAALLCLAPACVVTLLSSLAVNGELGSAFQGGNGNGTPSNKF